MNTTLLENTDDSNPLLTYIILAEGIINLLIALITAYKLDAISLKCEDFHCCCFHCDHFEFSEEQSHEKKNYENSR